jgi:hypothetical protein
VSDGPEPFSGRLIEIITVLVLGITTLGTAWCSYEAYQWNRVEADLSQSATTEQLEASRLFGLATQKVSYDSTALGQYAVAYRSGDERLMQFYRTSLMRPGLLPFLDEWIAEVKAGHIPENLLSNATYMDEVLADYNAASARSADLDRQSNEAGTVAQRYLVTTILLAIGLFFGGVTASFRWPVAKLAMIGLAMIAIALAAIRLVDLPIEL